MATPGTPGDGVDPTDVDGPVDIDEKIPFTFKFTIIMAAVYVGWRLIQLGGRLIEWMF